jgi:putative membrane-bound dehydrogenase-like protein
MKTISLLSVAAAVLFGGSIVQAAAAGPVRVLFLGHDGTGKGQASHQPGTAFPKLAQALGRDAVYFDYVTSVDEALGDASYLGKFDALLMYCNHAAITSQQWKNLKTYVENGGGFVPVHSASWSFANQPEFFDLVGGRFAGHKTGVFKLKTLLAGHAAIKDVPELEAWDETYKHTHHNPKNRTVLQVREVAGPQDNITKPEPWTWIRTQGKGRIFYTASGHDERVWGRSEFHALMKKGILWAIGDQRRAGYERFISKRKPLAYETRSDIPNYEKRPEPLKYQLPLPAQDSMDYIQAPVGFDLQLFASEPDIVNPICMAWDERGRLWVAETVDYPNEITADRKGRDSIKILEDTDGDGRCDRVKTFVTGLNVPTSIVFANGGVIVAHAPDFLFFKDTDGDDQADVREVLNTGWGIKDTHAGPSNLRYGFNNQIWGTVGYSGYAGDRNGKANRFGSGVFKLKTDGTDITFLHQFNNNTWGLGFNSAGDVFGSTANNNPAFFGGFPASAYPGARGISALMIADSPTFHPITPNIRQVDVFGGYTAGAGYALATSDNFPKSWRDTMGFIAGPTGHLLGMYSNTPKGSGYQAKNAYSAIASADEWFSPVAAEVGPDGNLWVADWYNFIIQHNPTPSAERGGYPGERGKGNAHINPNRDRQHGRIYRMIWNGSSTHSQIRSLANATTAELVAALGNHNLLWRLTAQRLLVETKPQGVIQPLRRAILKGGRPAVHALWTLHGMGQLDREIHQAALLSKEPILKRNAINALGNSKEDIQLFFDTAVVADRDLHVRRVAFSKMAHFPKHASLKIAIPQLFRDKVNRSDEWLALALKTAARNQGASAFSTALGPNLLINPSFEKVKDGQPVGWTPHRYRDLGGTVFVHTQGKERVHTGNRALSINSQNGADAGWRTEVAVKPNTEHRLSGWIRTHGVRGAKGALLNVHGMANAMTRALEKRTDWTEVELFFSSDKRNKIIINCLYGGWGTSQGAAWYDDLSLQEVTIEADSANQQTLVGDPARGLKIFHEHPVASCVRCHQVDGKGGYVGPFLDGIALRKQPDYIRESLLDPQAKIAEGFPAEVSPMPPFGVLLPAQDIEDVMAYLLTLRKDPPPGTVKTVRQISFE